MEQNFVVCFDSGQHLRHWLYTEPVWLDVSRLYETNYQMTPERYKDYVENVLDTAGKLSPQEGGRENLLGKTVSWKFLRMTEGDVKPTWAVYDTCAGFLANYAFCQIGVPKAGIYTCVLTTVGAAAVFVNGDCCFCHREFKRTGNETYTFQVRLKAGLNPLLIALWNVHLHATNSFSLCVADTPVTAVLPLLPSENREELEQDFAKLYLKDTVIRKALVLCTCGPLTSPGRFFYEITGGEGVVTERRPFRFEEPDKLFLVLSETEELSPGSSFSLNISYETAGTGVRIPGPVFDFETMVSVAVPRAPYEKRCAFLRERYGEWAELPVSRVKYRVLYACLAKLAVGETYPKEWMEQGLAYLNGRYDCGDFGMHALLRMLYQYPETFSPDLLKLAKACVLNFKYHEDDGGPSMMFCRSENHRILFASMEYLAGKLYPHERFTQSGEQGIFHQQRGREAAEKWIREKGCYGFMEWHSNTYYEEDVIAMLNLYEFGADYDGIRLRAGNMLEFIGTLMASHSFCGVMATTHGRCYEKHLLYPMTEPTAHLCWLLCGTAKNLVCSLSSGALCLLTSRYRPNRRLETIGAAPVLETRSRMGLFLQRGIDGVPCYTCRFEEYMVSAALEHRPGTCGTQVQAGQILLEGELPVFCTSFENASEHTRPSYWGGQYRMPRSIATSHVLAYAYHIETEEGASHCYFPIAQFDETAVCGHWIAGRKGRAYLAVWCSAGFQITKKGPWQNRELLCTAHDAVWLLQLGTEREFQSFSCFCKAVKETAVEEGDGGIAYQSPTDGRIWLGYGQKAAREGITFDGPAFPLIENSFVSSVYGSGLHRLPGQLLNFRD